MQWHYYIEAFLHHSISLHNQSFFFQTNMWRKCAICASHGCYTTCHVTLFFPHCVILSVLFFQLKKCNWGKMWHYVFFCLSGSIFVSLLLEREKKNASVLKRIAPAFISHFPSSLSFGLLAVAAENVVHWLNRLPSYEKKCTTLALASNAMSCHHPLPLYF